jgi:hypothetical protein
MYGSGTTGKCENCIFGCEDCVTGTSCVTCIADEFVKTAANIC